MYVLTDQGLRDYFLQWLEDRYVRQAEGKGLSTNDFTDGLKLSLESLAESMAAMVQYTTLAQYGITDAYTKAETGSLLDEKVDKVTGKALSSNDFTAAFKTQLESLANYSTLAQYNITDAYTKQQIDALLTSIRGVLDTLSDDVDGLKHIEGQMCFKGDITYAELILIVDAKVSDVYRISTDDAQGRAKAADKFMWTGEDWEKIGSSVSADEFVALEDCQILKASDIDALFTGTEEDDGEEGEDGG